MKNTILKRQLLMVFLPFFVVYGILSFWVLRSVYKTNVQRAQNRVLSFAQFNRVNLENYISNTRLSVTIAAEQLERIDPALPSARRQAEDVIMASFENKYVYNSWMIFEPNAFDGRDGRHRGEYSGETSGRFIRSFVRTNDGIVTAPDIQEDLLDDYRSGYWYIIPKHTGMPYIDLTSPFDLYWDYGVGSAAVKSITVVFPLFRNGNFIGCVGQDFLLDDLILQRNLPEHFVAALFLPDGTLKYTPGNIEEGRVIRELGFSSVDRIFGAFGKGNELFLSDEYSVFTGGKGYHSFIPVIIEDFNELIYLYTAVPNSALGEIFSSVMNTLIISLAIALFLMLAEFVYVFWNIIKPIHELTEAAEEISNGNLGRTITVSKYKDEIGIMTRSLRRMVEQFRVYLDTQEQTTTLLNIYTRLHRSLYQNDLIEDTFDEIIASVCDYFDVYRAYLVFVRDGKAQILSSFTKGRGTRPERSNEDFQYHNTVADLLRGRWLLSMNRETISAQKIKFAPDVANLCILPIETDKTLRGYIIMEGAESKGNFVHNDTALLFISETISYILSNREKPEERKLPDSFIPAPVAVFKEPNVQEASVSAIPPASSSLVLNLRNIKALNVDAGLLFIGGNEEQYIKIVKVTAAAVVESTKKMRNQFEDQSAAFAIEVHGIKSALYSIGAQGLGDSAYELEQAAKNGDVKFCREHYPSFEGSLLLLVQNINAMLPKSPYPGRKTGDADLANLIAALEKALTAVGDFDAFKAGEALSPFAEMQWAGKDSLNEALRNIVGDLDNFDYDMASGKIEALLEELKKQGTSGVPV